MPLIGGVLLVGPALVIEIVEQRGDTPKLFIGAGFAGIGANTRFDGEHVFAQALRRGVLAKQFPGVFAGRHAVLQTKPIV